MQEKGRTFECKQLAEGCSTVKNKQDSKETCGKMCAGWATWSEAKNVITELLKKNKCVNQDTK